MGKKKEIPEIVVIGTGKPGTIYPLLVNLDKFQDPITPTEKSVLKIPEGLRIYIPEPLQFLKPVEEK